MARVLDQVYNNPVVGRLKFPDYIAKVMQRLTKYPLLIEGILKNTLKVREEPHGLPDGWHCDC